MVDPSPAERPPRIRRNLIIAALLTLGALALCLVPRPRLDNSIGAMLVDDSPRAATYAAFQGRFGADEVVIVQFTAPAKHADRFFQRLARFEARMAAYPEVERTLGPASAYEDEFDLLLDPDMGGMGELPRLAKRFDGPLNRALGLITLPADGPADGPAAQLDAADGQYQGRVYAFIRPGPPEERAGLRAELPGLYRSGAHVAGPPILNIVLDFVSTEVQIITLPLLVAVCVIIMLGLTRSVRQTIAALAPVGLGVGATMGLLSLTGHSTDIVVNIAQPLIFVLLPASGLHVIVAWQDARRLGLDRHSAPWIAAREKGRACALALGTTALGFTSLVWSDMPAIRAFGAVSALGLGLGLPLVLWVLPALLQLLGGGPGPAGRQVLGGIAAATVSHAIRARWLWPLAALLITAGGLWTMTALPISTGGVHYFEDDARIRTDYEALEAAGVGLSSVELILDFDRAPDETILETVHRVGEAAEALDGVQQAVGLPLFLREVQWRANGQDMLPAGSLLAEALGADAAAGFVDGRGLRLSLLIDHLDATELDALHGELRRLVAETAPAAKLTLTGHHELVVHAQASLVDTLMWSLLTTALLIELIILVALRSFALTAAALLPMLAPVALNFGLMWALDIPLDLGTCMVGAIALGIAVDDALHFMIAWRKGPALACARSTGRALVLTTVVISAGFLSLMTADFAPTARFGLLTGVAMASALLADLLVLPPILQRLAPWKGEPAG